MNKQSFIKLTSFAIEFLLGLTVDESSPTGKPDQGWGSGTIEP